MLLDRSIFLQVCLLLTLSHSNCQDYESSYGVDESDVHPDVEDDSGLVDYSKYYAVDTSAPLVSAQGNPTEIGFTSPIEYAGFFNPSIDFGASVKQEVAQPKNPFAAPTNSFGFIANQVQFPNFASSGNFPIDYFEEAQKTQQNANQEQEDDGFISSGPTYISHNLPPHFEGDYSESRIQPKPAKKQNKKKTNYDVEREAAAEYDFQPSAPSGKYADYNTGKSSSTVAQYPQATGYFEKLSQTPAPTPYEKYSFQPVTDESVPTKYLGGLISTVAPFNPSYNKIASTAAPAAEGQSSENIPAHLKDKNCKRIRKHIPAGDEHDRRKREAMNCFVCEDPANSSKYTQCSYAVEPEPQNDYSGVSHRYSTPSKEPDGFRYKRYSGDEVVDPYEFIKARSQKAYNAEEKEYDGYKFPEFYTDDGLDKSFSEIQSEAITQNPANCHKEESNGMTCTICKDPKTGGNFEQCSYTSQPKEQKYAYVTEKKYDSDEPEHSSETKPAVQTTEIESSIKSTKEDKKDEPLHDYKPLSSSSNDNKKVEKYDNFQSKDYKSKLPSIDTSKYSAPKLEEYQPKEYKPITLPSIDTSKYTKLEHFDENPTEGKPETSASNDNEKYENFKPAELYKASYHGHDKFKLSDQYNPDSKEDSNNKREEYKPVNGYPGGQVAPKKLVQDEPYDIPKHFAESTIKEQKTGVRGLEPSLYGGADSAETEGDDGDSSSNVEPYTDIDEYHFKLFPEFSHEESQQAEVVANNPSADTTRKDVEEVLAEFTKKDRSACKKAQKNGMTCYLCVDNKGIQHEECMYISESKPQASHVAYHEVQQLKSPEGNKDEQVPAETEVKIQKITTAPGVGGLQAAASEEYSTKIKYNPKRNRKNVKKDQEQERSASEESPENSDTFDDEPKKETPAEFIVGAEEGAFSAETKPVYSKALGVKLPKYMIEKSEFEKEFDEFAGH